jgi:anti-sigma regulatory factor (Ser/Thr protein kinase)
VVIDLTDAGAVACGAVAALTAAAERAGCWPRPSLAVCGASSSLRPRFGPLVSVHADRRDALDHLDDRETNGVGREVAVEHGPQGPGQARQAVLRWATDIGLGPPTDDLLLLVSELVTNAVRYGSPPVMLTVSVDERTVTVGVVDASRARPVSRVAADDAESGRGLLLLSLLSTEHGVRPQSPGKVVWASLQRG